MIMHTSSNKLVAALFTTTLLIGALVYASHVKAQTRQNGHAAHHDVYREWKINRSNTPCCNEKKTVDGVVTGDCYPTRAALRPSANPNSRGDVWWVLLDTGQWKEVPEGRVNREINPDQSGEAAHVCETYDTILCFVPPFGGG